jgi:hypothetical protein
MPAITREISLALNSIMLGRFVAIPAAALHIIVCCSASFAATPLVIAEIEAKRTMAQADAARADAEHDLAAWKLGQLETLRRLGHASWQEVAEQQVTVNSAKASAQASERFLKAVLEWQTRLEKLGPGHTPEDSECVQLYLPRSARLVAWIPADVANPELLNRHLENLHLQHESLLEIDLSSPETAIKTAQHAVQNTSHSAHNTHLRSQAEIRLRLAKAEYDSARARKKYAGIIARRVALIQASLDQRSQTDEPSFALTRVGTRLVDATSDRELAGLVTAMAMDDALASKQIAWLKGQHEAVVAQIDALQALEKYSSAVHDELDQVKQRKTDLDVEIERAQIGLRVHQQIADDYERTFELPPSGNVRQEKPTTLDDAWLADASTVRHSLQMTQLKLQATASRAATEAHCHYLVERLKRVEQIPEQARSPKELDHLRHRVKRFQQRLAIADCELELFHEEQQRLAMQLRSQQGPQYQLVQVGSGGIIRRQQFELQAALIATVGYVGDAGCVCIQPAMYPYFESTTLLDCMSYLNVQPNFTTRESISRVGWEPTDGLLGRSATASRSAYGLRLATDGITYPSDLFCYWPDRFQPFPLDVRWATRASLCNSSACGFRTFDPYVRYPFAPSGQSIFSFRVGSPTRSSFPYRTNYLYRTAFPTRSHLYSSPAAGASPSFRYTPGLGESCFD